MGGAAEVSAKRRGLLLGLTGYALLTCGDTVVKSMAGDWAGTAVSTLRFAIGAAVLGVILAWRSGRAGFAVPRPWLQLARGAALGAAAMCFYLSLFYMPLADAAAITFSAPIVIALLSGWWFSEKVPRISWLAMLLAMAGVVLVLRPNVAELGLPALLPVAATIAMALFLLLNRISAQDVSPLAAQFWVALYVTPLQAAVTLAGHYSGDPMLAVSGWPSWDVVARCAVVAASASMAHLLLFLATRHVSAATMAPTSYVQLVIAVGAGILFFGDWPDLAAVAGISLIVLAGLILWYSHSTTRSAS